MTSQTTLGGTTDFASVSCHVDCVFIEKLTSHDSMLAVLFHYDPINQLS